MVDFIRVTQEYVEVVHTGDPASQDVRVTQQYLEVITSLLNRLILPDSFSDTDTFYNATISGAYSLTPGIVTDSDSFYSPSAAYNNSLTPSLIAADDQTFSPTASSANSLLADLFSDVDVVFAADIADTDTVLTAALFSDADAFFSASVVPDQILEPSLFTETDTFFAPTAVPGADTLFASLFSDSDTFFAPNVAGPPQFVLFDLTLDGDAFFSPIVSGAGAITAGLVTDADVVRTTIAASSYPLHPTLFSDADIFFAPVASTGPITLHPSLFNAADVFFVPTVQAQKKQGGGGSGGGGGGVTSDVKYATSLVMAESGLITTLEVTFTTAKTVNTRMMIYADAAGVPGALVAQSAVKTAVTIGANDYTLAVPYAVLAGTKVWLALHTDANVSWFLTNSPGGSRFNIDTFTDGPSDPFGTSSLDNKRAPVFAIFLVAVNATMLPGSVAADDVFAQSLESATDTLLAPFVNEPDAIYSVDALAVDGESPEAVASDDSVPAASVAATYQLMPGLLIDSDIVLSPNTGSQGSIFSADVPDDDRVYVAAVQAQGADLLPSLFADSDAINAVGVAAAKTLTAGLYSDDDAIEPTGAGYSNEVSPPWLEDLDDVNNLSPVVELFAGDLTLHQADCFIDSETIFAPAVRPVLFVEDDLVLKNRVFRTQAISNAVENDKTLKNRIRRRDVRGP